MELQETKGQQKEHSVQVQRLKDKVAQMKESLGQAQQRVVSEGCRQHKALRVASLWVARKKGERHG